MKRLLLTIVISATLVCAAPAQVLEGLLFAAGSQLLGRALTPPDKTISAVKPMCDIMVPTGDPKCPYRFTNTVWDPTTQTSVFMVDGLAFKVKSFTNSLPSRELRYYLNDALVTTRRVEADKGRGVVGDYPIIDSKDIPYGANQIKIVHNKREIGSFTFVRVPSVGDVVDIAGDEEMRQKLYGFGGATFPSLPTFVARMPDGAIRSFLSLDEAKAAIASFRQVSAAPKTELGKTDSPGELQGGRLPEQPEPWGGEVATGFYQGDLTTETVANLRLQKSQLISRAHLTVPADRCVAILLTSSKPFAAVLVDADGKQHEPIPSDRKDNHFEKLLRVKMDGKPIATIYISDADKRLSTLELTLKGN